MLAPDLARLFGLDEEVLLADLDDVVNFFEWYTGLPAAMDRIEALFTYSRDISLTDFFLYLVNLDAQSSACLSVQV
jgi:hypothetical protein